MKPVPRKANIHREGDVGGAQNALAASVESPQNLFSTSVPYLKTGLGTVQCSTLCFQS